MFVASRTYYLQLTLRETLQQRDSQHPVPTTSTKENRENKTSNRLGTPTGMAPTIDRTCSIYVHEHVADISERDLGFLRGMERAVTALPGELRGLFLWVSPTVRTSPP